VLDDVLHQLIDDQSQGNSHVRRDIHALDIGLNPIGTTTSSAEFATQIAEEGVETQDGCILARVETLMYGSNREDPGSRAAQRIGGSVLCVCRTCS
jgi:hypothetical protein